MRALSGAAAALAALGFLSIAPTGAKASVVLTANLTEDHCGGGCSVSPFVDNFGTVTITQVSSGSVLTVDVQLTAPYFFQPHTGNANDSFVFNPVGTGAVNVVTANFATAAPSNPEDGFKNFT